MKNFKMKPVKLSKAADLKIRARLLLAQFKKNFQALTLLKFAIPALMFGVLAIGIFQNIGTLGPDVKKSSTSRIVAELSEIRADKYKRIAKRRAYVKKASHYKQYAYVRSVKLRNR